MNNKQKIFDFSNKCVSRLSDIVGEMNTIGKDQGFTQEEIKKVWLTIFSIFHKNNSGITRQIVSKYCRILLD